MKYFTPKERPGPPKADKEQEETVSAPAVTPKPLPQLASPPLSELTAQPGRPLPTALEKEITIDTPFYQVVFSSVGATIKNFRLKSYLTNKGDDAEPEPVDLVHLDVEKGHPQFLEARFDGLEAFEQEKRIFTTSTDETSITVFEDGSPRELSFQTNTVDGLHITKTFRFYPDRYPIDLQVTVRNGSAATIKGSLELFIRNIPPEKKKSYYSFNGIALLYNGDLEELKQKKLKEPQIFNGPIGWVAYEDNYFISALIPEEAHDAMFVGQFQPTSRILEAKYALSPQYVDPQSQITSQFTLYFGPRDYAILKALDKNLDKAINFGFTNVIAKPLHITLRFLYRYVKNYGLAIIILTIMIKIIFWPLTRKSYKSMKEMQKLQPLMKKMREKYKNDKAQMNRELMGLYKTYKVNPMGGCLPMVIQIPVFFALFRILGTAIELRHAPFVLWIDDLSAPDRLLDFPFSIPFMSPPYGIPVLTLLMGASMFIQQKLTPTPGDPAQAKMMLFLPVIFTFMFINFPSGLVLYWLINNLISIGQQYQIKR
jgi:YidC/Oxa1 family membrane protein insertase